MKLYLGQADDPVYRWLSGVRLERYYQLFADAGYDLPTVSRMTPEVDDTHFTPLMLMFIIHVI